MKTTFDNCSVSHGDIVKNDKKGTCVSCSNAYYTGGQIGYAEKEEISLSVSHQIYCKGNGYVDKGSFCEHFKPKPT